MDFMLFFTILVYTGAVWSGLLTIMSLANWFHFEHTDAGRMERKLLQAMGKRITGYYFTIRFISFIVCIAAIVSLK